MHKVMPNHLRLLETETHAHTSTYTHICTHMNTHVHKRTHAQAYTHAHIHTRTHACTHSQNMVAAPEGSAFLKKEGEDDNGESKGRMGALKVRESS